MHRSFLEFLPVFLAGTGTGIPGCFPGVCLSYAIQAGREIRVMVTSEQVSDEQSVVMARDIAKKIEAEMTYPGQIKVNVIRETRSVEYAR